MKIPDEFAQFENADEWAIRSEFWISETTESLPNRRLRQRNPTPLILCGHGVSMRIENGTLIIRDGFTHYPQQQAAHRFFRGDLDLPPRIVLLDGSGTLSFEVLSWLAEHGIALARIKWTGEVAIVASGTGYASDREKVRWQQETRADDVRRRAFAIDMIQKKLAGSIGTLENCLDATAARNKAVASAVAGIERLAAIQSGDMTPVFAIEGECAATYFTAWTDLALSWKGTGRRPIPDDWLTYQSRRALTSGSKPKNRLASHPINAMLNYAYTVRQTKLHIQAVADGYDPMIGIMHNPHQGSAAYILDIIEPERPKVDALILNFIQTRSFAPADFILRSDGVCRLSPQLAKSISQLCT